MATFELGGKPYTLRLTHRLVKQVKADSGTDFYALADDPERYVQEVALHTYRLYPAVYAAVKDQAGGLDYEAWLDPLDGPAASAIREALVEAMADFFPGHPLTLRLRAAGTTAGFLTQIADLVTGADGSGRSAGGPG